MRIGLDAAERLSGFDIGDRVRVAYETRDGSLTIKVGAITKITRQGVAVQAPDDNFPIMFEYGTIHTISRTR